MKFTQKRAALVIAGAALMALYGCGGGDGASTPAGPLVGSSTGVLTDAAVEGVAYTTTSGVTGTTNALGQYTYNDNLRERIIFKLGALTLGDVPAASIVTPLELAEGNADKLTNLLVLLQSMDDDGDVSERIKITRTAAAGVGSSVDLAQAAASFASSANTSLLSAMRSGGISRSITSTSQATAHFLEQSKRLFSSEVWVGFYEGDAILLVQRFGPGGEFIFGDLDPGPAGGGGQTGLEYGTALATSVDGRGFQLATTIEIDTNGTWGLSTQTACTRVSVAGGKLSYLDGSAPGNCVTDEVTAMSKAENDPNGIVGVWALGSATVVKTQTFVFLANGKFAMLDPIGDTEADSCGGPGVEYGTYSYNAVSKQFNVLSVLVDTNGCVGLNDGNIGGSGMASFSFTLSSDGKTATAVGSDATEQFFRVSR
jgi:hypothetical protein